MAPKSVVGICFFITAPPINHQHIFLLCCTSGCKDHFVVLVALVNPTSSFNRSYWLEDTSTLLLLGLGKDNVYNLGTEMFTIIKISSKN